MLGASLQSTQKSSWHIRTINQNNKDLFQGPQNEITMCPQIAISLRFTIFVANPVPNPCKWRHYLRRSMTTLSRPVNLSLICIKCLPCNLLPLYIWKFAVNKSAIRTAFSFYYATLRRIYDWFEDFNQGRQVYFMGYVNNSDVYRQGDVWDFSLNFCFHRSRCPPENQWNSCNIIMWSFLQLSPFFFYLQSCPRFLWY